MYGLHLICKLFSRASPGGACYCPVPRNLGPGGKDILGGTYRHGGALSGQFYAHVLGLYGEENTTPSTNLDSSLHMPNGSAKGEFSCKPITCQILV